MIKLKIISYNVLEALTNNPYFKTLVENNKDYSINVTELSKNGCKELIPFVDSLDTNFHIISELNILVEIIGKPFNKKKELNLFNNCHTLDGDFSDTFKNVKNYSELVKELKEK